jgi:hypothetical protein
VAVCGALFDGAGAIAIAGAGFVFNTAGGGFVLSVAMRAGSFPSLTTGVVERWT